MPMIDAHIHCRGDHPDCTAALARLDVKLLNVCVAHQAGAAWREQADAYRALAAASPDRFAWCTTFDVPDVADPGWAERVIAGLEQDRAAGAVACKAWKNIGMELRTPAGEFLMIDDPVFDPVFAYLARAGVPLLAHIGEPRACWRPLEEAGPHAGYYRSNPQWHMYNHPEYPSHEQLIAARDRMLARHPGLRVIGAHLGSLEYDVAAVAARLDRYPNFAVDTSARLADLACQDAAKVREFILAYPDRVLFGTDIVQRRRYSEMTAAERQAGVQRLEDEYALARAYFASSEMVTVRGYQTPGLALPAAVLEQLYWRNAATWYPGV